MAEEPLQLGQLVEILPVTAPPPGQPAAPRRFGRVLEATDENGRVAVQVEGRQHPLRVPAQQVRQIER